MRDPEPSAQIGRDDALRLGRRKYLAGERLDIGQMAQELGVNRVTLHRWVGTRDALIAEAVWPLTQAALKREWTAIESCSGARVPRLVGAYLRAHVFQAPAQRFMREENERAMKIFTLAEYGFQPRMVAQIREYLQLDVESGRINSPLSLDELAYATERIAGSYAYLPTITGQEPDPDGAERVLDALMSGGSR